MKKMLSILLACLMLAGMLTACTSAPASPSATAAPAVDSGSATQGGTEVSATAEPETEVAPHGTLNLYTTTKITNLNPFENGDTDAGEILNGTSMKLYAFIPNEAGDGFVIAPEMAADEPVALNADQTEWEIKIREGLVWQDGTPITTKDVIYSAKMCLDPLLLTRRAATYANNYIIIKNAEAYYLQKSKEGAAAVDWADVGIQAVDDYTLRLTLESFATASDVKQHFASKWCTLVNEKLFESCMSADRATNTYGTSLDTYMSCGQYILTDFQPGVSFSFERNADYPLANLTKLEGWTYTYVADANTALELFLNGELDTAALSASAKEQYEDDPRVWIAPSDTVQCMIVNIGNTDQNAILQNVNFRKALFHAIDRVSVAKLVKGIPANYILGQKCLSNPDTGDNYRALESSSAYLTPNNGYDAELAKTYLATALSECGLSEVSMTLLYSESSANTKKVVEYLNTALPAVLGDNFHVTLEAQSSSVAKDKRKAWAKGDDPNSYELTFTGWTTSAVAPWNAMKVYCGWYSGKNEPYFNDAYDALWELANNGREAKENNDYRVELTQQMEKMALDDVVTIPMYEIPSYRLIADRVQLGVNHYVEGIEYAWRFASIAE